MLVRDVIRPLPGVSRLSLLRQRAAFRGSARYWERNYAEGGTSGAGSYDALALGKAAFLNEFVRIHEIGSVIDFGCGDGNQLSLADYPAYIGLDVSRTAIRVVRTAVRGRPGQELLPVRRRLLHRPGRGVHRRPGHLARRHLSPDRGRGLRGLPDAPVRRRGELRDHLRDRRGTARYRAARPAPPLHPLGADALPGVGPAGGDAGAESRSRSRGFLHLPASAARRLTTLSVNNSYLRSTRPARQEVTPRTYGAEVRDHRRWAGLRPRLGEFLTCERAGHEN